MPRNSAGWAGWGCLGMVQNRQDWDAQEQCRMGRMGMPGDAAGGV